MGRIKSIPIKTLGDELMRKYPEKFSTDFEKNKKALGEIADIGFKRTRNIAVGYITNEMKKKAQHFRKPRRPPVANGRFGPENRERRPRRREGSGF